MPSLKGDGAYIGDEASTFNFAIKDMQQVSSSNFSLCELCEGCEWEMLPDAVQSGLYCGYHSCHTDWLAQLYDAVGLGERVKQYCNIHQQLSKIHDLVF